jgi:hypothetical protein
MSKTFDRDALLDAFDQIGRAAAAAGTSAAHVSASC